MALKLNDTYVKNFVSEDELTGLAPQITAAETMIREKSGLGNDFLGWVEIGRASCRERV